MLFILSMLILLDSSIGWCFSLSIWFSLLLTFIHILEGLIQFFSILEVQGVLILFNNYLQYLYLNYLILIFNVKVNEFSTLQFVRMLLNCKQFFILVYTLIWWINEKITIALCTFIGIFLANFCYFSFFLLIPLISYF